MLIMHLSTHHVLLLCIVGELLGLYVFLKGFFPVKKAVEGYATFDGLPKEPFAETLLQEDVMPSEITGSATSPIHPVFGRLIIVLIDALRADFIYGKRNQGDMPYTRELLGRGWTRSFLARAHPPTVTMPRIKALTSGTIPGFIDIVLNLDSSALAEDNLISQMHRQDKTLFFYGDDTWMRLFPGHFTEADGTTSFFVTDYSEVDDNVTRHVQPALSNPKWDALILHYLGLDHIGHLGGPTSPLVPPKLLEMDGVIRNIHQAIIEQDKSLALPSLMVLCGDHGMSDAGSHGGASSSETITPLVFISSAFKQDQEAPVPHPEEVQQIDLAPTLAILLGLPIPQNSLGQAIPAMLEGSLSAREHLRALQLNSYQLSRVLEQNIDSFESDMAYSMHQHALRLHATWLSHTANGSTHNAQSLFDKATGQYLKAMGSMRNRVASSLSRYDLHAMGCGVVLLWQVVFLLCYSASSLGTRTSVTPDLKPSLLLLIGCCLAAGLTQIALCTAAGGETSELLCIPSIWARVLSLLLTVIGGSLAAFLVSTGGGCNRLRKVHQNFQNLSWSEMFLLVGTVSHTLTLAASSFVEEEHQTWHFLTLTLLLSIFIYVTTSAIGQSMDKMVARVATAMGAVLVVCRLLRAWNQTGMKWADRPDIGDWFVRPENKTSLSILTMTSFMVIYITRCFRRPNYRLLGALVAAYLYRYATGSVDFPVSLPTSQKGLYEAWLVYILVFVSLAKVPLRYGQQVFISQNQSKNQEINLKNAHKTNSKTVSCFKQVFDELYDIHIMMVALLLRPHNSAVAAMSVVLQYCIVGMVLPWLQMRAWAVALVHIWMGQASFFAQGNSNSIATVDISAGYVGMSSYVHSVAGLLTCISTYAGPILWMLSLYVFIAEHHSQRYNSAVLEVIHTLALTRALPLATYTVLVSLQRYHLFVWSVFSPKLLYETMHTNVVTAGIAVLLVHLGIIKWLTHHEMSKNL